MVLAFYQRLLPEDRELAYVRRGRWPRGGPEWAVHHRLARPEATPARIIDDHGNAYRLAAQFDTAGLAGFRTEATADVTLQRTNRDGLVEFAASATFLARRAANSAADRSQRIRPARDQIRKFVAAIRYGPDVATGVGMDGTRGLAVNLRFPVLAVRDFNQRL